MHRTDGDAHVANMFDEGDPGVPRHPTQVTADWMNDVQENIAQTIEAADITLVKGTYTQLAKATGLLGGSGGERTFDDNSSNPILTVTQQGSGKAIAASSDGANSTITAVNTSAGPAMTLESQDAHWPLLLVPVANIPITNPAGGALSAADDGALVFVAGALNNLYVYSHSNGGWKACGA